MSRKRTNPQKVTALTATQKQIYPIVKQLLSCAILILCTSIVYYPSLKVPFLLDDNSKIIRNPDIKSLDYIPSRLIYPYESPPIFNRNDPSRPLTFLTLTLNYYFDQLDPYGYHVINIALHIVVVLLIFLLASLIFSLIGIVDITFPFITALIFAVHPINVNVVTYIIGRAASLATVFYLSSVILFIQSRKGNTLALAISIVCFIFSLASNQLALTLPAVIFVIDLCFFSGGAMNRIAENWRKHAFYWGLLGVYLLMRITYFGKVGDMEAAIPAANQAEYMRTESVVIWKYIGLAVFPVKLCFEHLYGPLKQLSDPRVLIAATFYLTFCISLVRALKNRWQLTNLILFGILWFIITISPTSSIFPTTATMAENRVYLPLIGLCLIIPYIGNALIYRIASEHHRERILLSVFSVYIMLLGYLTVRRNILYQDPIRILMDVIRQYPEHERAHKDLAIAYATNSRFDEAIVECQKAMVLDPRDFDVRNNLAMIYFKLGRYKEALEYLKKIEEEQPKDGIAYVTMGLVYMQLDNADAAVHAFQIATHLNPTLITPLLNLGNIYLAEGKPKEATNSYRAALQLDPKNDEIRKLYASTSSNP